MKGGDYMFDEMDILVAQFFTEVDNLIEKLQAEDTEEE